jgi:hypothetical protein
MSRARALCVLLATATFTCSLSHPADAQGVVNAFIAGAEAGEREKLQAAQIEILRLQREILAETLHQQRQAEERLARTASEARQRAAEAAATTQSAAQAMTEEILREFTRRHADWPQYESAMLAYAAKMPPGQIDLQSYLDALYFLAKRDDAEAVPSPPLVPTNQGALVDYPVVDRLWSIDDLVGLLG